MRALSKGALAAAAASSVAGQAWAHGAQIPSTSLTWTFDPWITAPLLVGLGLFAAGWRRLSARSRRGASALQRRAALFSAGLMVLAAALVSPLHAAGERSFAAHMLEHELLMLAAAPLIVMSEPLAIMLWALPVRMRRALGRASRRRGVATPWRFLTQPVTATLLQAAALWLWHAPALFERALASDGWHIAQHLSFLVSALLFWKAMLKGRRHAQGLAALCLFATSVVSGALGALMALASSPWYAGYARLGLAPLGLSPLEDQQLAGLLMWIPGGAVHAVAALALIAAALKAQDRRAQVAGEGAAYVGQP